MPLPGVVPFPPEFARKYREKGYWRDKSLAEEFAVCFSRFSTRVFLVDGEKQYTYAEIDKLSTNLALNLLELGLKPLDRVVPTLPNVAEFVILYFALQKIGCVPIAALATHRFAEVNQFVKLSGATACFYPERQGDFEFEPMIQRVKTENSSLKFCISLAALRTLIGKPSRGKLNIEIDPTDPCIFQLSGGRRESRSSSRARTTTTPSTPRPPRRCAR
jgi:2,3-dihydroxybenzoate-AMP ligase